MTSLPNILSIVATNPDKQPDCFIVAHAQGATNTFQMLIVKTLIDIPISRHVVTGIVSQAEPLVVHYTFTLIFLR